jgi:hypothetical protein
MPCRPELAHPRGHQLRVAQQRRQVREPEHVRIVQRRACRLHAGRQGACLRVTGIRLAQADGNGLLLRSEPDGLSLDPRS